MKTMRFPIFGTGFWSRYQLAAWRELEDAECVALFNRTKSNVQNKPGMFSGGDECSKQAWHEWHGLKGHFREIFLIK
jgi:hypothetical protein